MNYSALCQKTQQWASQAYTAGWLSEELASSLMQIETTTEKLIISQATNTSPLIVAFMGGTGVGKSSLLNRLAGQAIARAGIERPTSHEITLYHHNSITLNTLAFSENCRIAQHQDATKKALVWIDMPDFDSTEAHNKQQVLQCLPHIDVLIYVVSPERYRDAKAWRLLLAEGAKHAWVFAFNQWDKAQTAQHEDFKQQLDKAGFHAPLIFKTSCLEHCPDEFKDLENTLLSLANEHTIEQLSQRSLQLKINVLKDKLQQSQQALSPNITQLSKHWQQHWQQGSDLLQQGLSLPIEQLASHYAEQNTSSQDLLWDAWAQARFSDIVQDFIITATEIGISEKVLKKAFINIETQAAKLVQNQSELSLRLALAKPGNSVQRALLNLMRYCEIVLPLTAMAWVSYRVLNSYYYNFNNNYLGVDFAIHSSLLIALTWLVPYFILKKAQPSLKKTALRALNKALNQALQAINHQVLAIIESINHDYHIQQQQLNELIEHCVNYEIGIIDDNSDLKRMLIA